MLSRWVPMIPHVSDLPPVSAPALAREHMKRELSLQLDRNERNYLIRSVMMKIFYITVASLATLGSQPVLAYEDALTGQMGSTGNQPVQQGQRGNTSR
ncbi:MAG: hypothetical protein KGM95_07700, partial [Betaproteobacteria bacterium]|nr:hypothetical protein [Betaproteobacteria bacterium]